MSQGGNATPLLERRAIEAEILVRVYEAACATHGPAAALRLLEQAVDAAALAAGRQFALTAPQGGPSLAHFATILERWQEGGVLDIRDVLLDETALRFTVTRCGYAQRYADMGVPAHLRTVFSCRRDAAFVEGYSARLAMDRPDTIAEGCSSCGFVFRWQP